MVIKSHFTYISDWPLMAFKETGVKIYGALTMNQFVGGINPYGLRAALGPEENGLGFLKIVWMPTIHSPAHIQRQKNQGHKLDIPPEWTGGRDMSAAMRLEEIDPISIRSPEILPKLDKVLSNDLRL